MEKWIELAHRVVSHGLVPAGDLDSLTAGGPDFYGLPDQVVHSQTSDHSYGLGYKDGRPCLFTSADYDEYGHEGYGYSVPPGFVYEDPYTGFVWMAGKEEGEASCQKN